MKSIKTCYQTCNTTDIVFLNTQKNKNKEFYPCSDGLAVIADYDYSDAPEWALPREWFVEGRYDLEWESI